MKHLLSLLLLVPFIGCGKYQITQEISACQTEGKMQIYTFVHERMPFTYGNIIYSSRTWSAAYDSCLPLDSIPIVKEREHKKAELFIEKYKTIDQ